MSVYIYFLSGCWSAGRVLLSIKAVLLLWNKLYKILYNRVLAHNKLPVSGKSFIFYFSVFHENYVISVLVPTYNRAAFIEKALVSVLNQTRPCDEVLVIDDGSSDATEAIVSRIAGQNTVEVRYIYQQNRGASAARNRGIAEARYDIFCFLDSDDWWDLTKLELQLAAMEQEPDYLVSHTRELWYRHGKRVNQKIKHLPTQGDIFSRSLEMCVVGMSTVMVRRQLFEQYGFFDESLLCCEDYDLWLRVGRKEPFLLIDEPLTLKDGGRGDQLSAIHRLGMDTWRIRSIRNLI
ncbi:MAG: glycosyltransferase family 2 protein, partial [Deltaproteobacteria bacterium]|nr:glycosyltransferase family 2 protein [Deltaproteobacteria bacterium]